MNKQKQTRKEKPQIRKVKNIFQADKISIKHLAQDAGKSDREIKLLVEDAKKIS